jgi:uncharacterized caspase-like protein
MNPLHYGVVIGINRYPDIRHLNYARGDAEKFTEWLTNPEGGGVPRQNVITIVVDDVRMKDGTPREDAIPTRAEIFKALYKFRKDIDQHVNGHPEDWEQTRLYFYVSGHGIAPDAKDAALLLANAGPDWYGENISCARLIAFMTKNQPFREVVVFADCCRERVPNAPLGDVCPPWTLVERDNGHVLSILGCATYFGDLAYEPLDAEPGEPDKLRGYFTQALLEGLKEEAADTKTGVIDSNTLAAYVKLRVLDLTKDRPYPQKPTMDADPAEPIIFRPPALPVEVKHKVWLEFVTPYEGKAELWDSAKAISEHDMADGAWVERLTNGLYEVRPAVGSSIQLLNSGFFRVLGEDKHVKL